MPDGYYRDVRDILLKLSFDDQTNAKGSHEKWRSRTTGKRVFVPHNLKSRPTADAILKDAGYAGKL